MEGKFGKGVTTPKFVIEYGAELECWNKFIRRFEIAVIGAGLTVKDTEGVKSRGKKDQEEFNKFLLEQRKAALLLDSMGEIGMDIFETWNVPVDGMQYEDLKREFERHFQQKENIVATRHRYLSIEQRTEEKIDSFIERVERAARTCRWGGLEDAMIVQIVIKGMTNEKVRAELLGKKDLDVRKVRSVCFRFQAAKTAADIISDGHKLKPEIDRVQEAGQTEIKLEEAVEIDRVGSFSGSSRGAGNNNYGYRGRGNFRGRGGRGGGRGRGRGCFLCGGDHFMRDCTEKRKPRTGCFVCGGPHYANECTEAKSKDKGESKPGRVNAVSGCYSDSEESL